MNKLAPRSTPNLRKLKFELVSLRSNEEKSTDLSLREKVDTILRHPATLVILTFVLTTVLAQHLTREHAAADAQREAESKREEDVRTALNDLLSAYSTYLIRTIRLLEDPRSGQGFDEGTEKYRNYDNAYLGWRQSLAKDLPTIKSAAGNIDETVFNAALFIELNSAVLDSCLRTSCAAEVEPKNLPVLQVVCKNPFDPGRELSVYNWLDSLERVRNFYSCYN